LTQTRSLGPVTEAVRRPDKPGYRPDIEGLRAVAVVAVVLFHANVPGVTGGFIGVDVFFVISGYLITGLLWREASAGGTVRLRSFYGARARRLLPASAMVGIVIAITSAFLLPSLQARSVFGDGIASALYVGNYWFILHGVDYLAPVMPPSPYEHYWSLGVEEQFYLLWPGMILVTAWLIRRMRRCSSAEATSSTRPYVVVLATAAIVSFALSLVVTYVVPAIAFFGLPTRAWQLAIGGLVALGTVRLRRLPPAVVSIASWGGLALILLACVLLDKATLYPGTAALLPTLGAALVIGAGCAGAARGCGRMLSVLPMQAAGRVSYSWYLWHWPVLLFSPLLIGHELTLVGRFAAILVSLGLAMLTLHLIENPLRFAQTMRRSAAHSLALGGTVTALAVAVCVALLAVIPVRVGPGAPAAPMALGANGTFTVPQAFDEIRAAIAAATEPRPVASNLTPGLTSAADELMGLTINSCMRDGTGLPSKRSVCTAGDTASPTTLALVGDSHATMWDPAFRQVVEQRRWKLVTMSKAACPLMDMPVTNPIRRVVSQCGQWRDQVIATLRAERPKLVVVSMWRGYATGKGGYDPGWTAYDPAWLDGVTRLVKELREIGAKVLVLGPVADPHVSVPICVSGHLDDATACAPPRAAAVNEPGVAAESAATVAGGGQYVDVTDLFCTAERCPVIVGDTLMYFDWSHITSEYARELAPLMGALADRELAGARG
jgi:peptidoglycan/LPS O-acetylase OafA/YrhL